jgi:hypothetical protein
VWLQRQEFGASVRPIVVLLRKCGGRKRIVTPDGSAIVPTSKPQPDGTLVKALARAWRWQRMLDAGVSRSRGLPDKCVEQLLCRECSA